MKELLVALTVGFLFCPAAFSQINVQTEDGNTVTIGPDGINVQSKDTNLNIGPGGIHGVAGGQKTRINMGSGVAGQQTKTTSSVRNKTKSSTARVNTNAASSSVSKTNTASQQVKLSGAASLQDRVSQLEIAASGKTSAGSLLARVEKLELDNLGKKGAGSLKERIDALAISLGVSQKSGSSVSRTTVNTASTSSHTSAHSSNTGSGVRARNGRANNVSIDMGGPGGIQVDVESDD